MTLDCTCNRLKEAEAKAAKWDGIVRCRECRWRKFSATRGVYECSRVVGLLAPSFGYCAWGERREDA